MQAFMKLCLIVLLVVVSVAEAARPGPRPRPARPPTRRPRPTRRPMVTETVEPVDITDTPAPEDTCEDAEQACLLTFRGTVGLQTFGIQGPPNKAFTPNIVSKDPTVFIGVVNSNIEGEFIEEDGDVVLFSKAIPAGTGITPFSPNVFKPFFPSTNGMFSGIGVETLQTGQSPFARGKCVRVFITEWQILSRDNRVIGNVNGKTNKRENICVVFRTAM
eukprot:Plantae.Rhodophyta-Hildenbrandia_rubra.ctg3206.p1 GENE.Plantae.Rhodophyta-Hildenbrandia_rubra.ctg3206~~Plantae.Rhodophyta-Hildenbrandia_rubra.ctg3206.p1  ORF type:complete len:218 (+),score=22.48 Plantae.Rhodophyta-Hildenbrandia_rubra.ctg3206:901-1554(+)